MTIKASIARWILNRRIRLVSRKKKVHNLDSAKEVGVLWSIDQKAAFMQLVRTLNDKDLSVDSLCYIPTKTEKDERIRSFTKKELNWLGFPPAALTHSFSGERFDILIDLTIQEYFPVQVLLAQSRASYKVGYAESYPDFYDLAIEFAKKPESGVLAEQIVFYLERINKIRIE